MDVKAFLYREIAALVDYIDAKKSMNTQDVKDAVDWLLNDYWSQTIDEVVLVIREMKKESNYFERLKYPEIKLRLDSHFNSEEREERIVRHNQTFKIKEMDNKTIKDVDYNAFKLRMSKEEAKEDNSQSDFNNFKADYIAKRDSTSRQL